MKFSKITASILLAAFALSACTTTSSQTKSAQKGAIGKGNVVAVTGAKRLDDLYSDAAPSKIVDESLPQVYADNLSSDKKIVVKLQSDFGRRFHLCDVSDKCEEVMPIAREASSSGGFHYTGDKSAVDDSFIGEVHLSEATKALFGKPIPSEAAGRKILIMDPDVELNLLTAGGLKEPNALWTSAAKGYVTEMAAQYFQKLGHQVTIYSEEANNVDSKTGQDLINLHEAVGQSIFMYQYDGLLQLPTKKNNEFNWKLGKTAKTLKAAYGADLGLFVYMRDSYSSGGRVAAQLLMSALFGVHIPGGQQVGFVSLVDMERGDIVWFNRLFSTTGDLRTFGAALNATDALLKDIPL